MKIAMYSDQFFPELSGITDTVITTGETLRAQCIDGVRDWLDLQKYKN